MTDDLTRPAMPSIGPRPIQARPEDAAAHVVFDLDGTLAGYIDGFRRYLQLEEGLTVADAAEKYPTTTLYDFLEWGMDRDRFVDAHHRAITQGRLYLTLQPLPGALRAARAFSDAGCWNQVLTHRFVLHGTASATVKDTADWLDIVRDPVDVDAPVGVPYREISVSGRKVETATGADLVFEDSPTNIEALEAAGFTVITIAQPYNVGVGRHRADTWDDAVTMASDLLDLDICAHYRPLADLDLPAA